MNDRVEIVRFSGGVHHGLVVEAPSHVAARLHTLSFEVLATGRLYDTARQRRIPGARVISAATEQPQAPPPAAPAPSTTPPAASTATLGIADGVPGDTTPPAWPVPPTQRPRQDDTAQPAQRPTPTMPLFQPARSR
jgi:hypothetical protein